jgi:DNA-binding response OmpR family regulator
MLDVLLPQANGWDVLQDLKRDPATAHTPVVVVSILEQQRLGLMLGATDYLVKPFERTQFLTTLERLAGTAAQRPRVLVVDDEPAIRDILGTLLEQEGYRVYTADDGVEALEQIVATRPGILLLDLMLPRLDGFAVLEWVRAHHDPAIREMPIVLVTAKDVTPDERRRLTTATEQLISKVGLSLDDLLGRVKETLQQLHATTLDHRAAGPPRGRT